MILDHTPSLVYFLSYFPIPQYCPPLLLTDDPDGNGTPESFVWFSSGINFQGSARIGFHPALRKMHLERS